MTYKLLDDLPVGTRRIVSAMLATFLTFVIIRVIFNLELSWRLMLITFISAGLGSVISKFMHNHIVKEGE